MSPNLMGTNEEAASKKAGDTRGGRAAGGVRSRLRYGPPFPRSRDTIT